MTAARAMDAMGEPTRRAIMAQLEAGPRTVGELAAPLPVGRPAVSQHLKVLAAAGLVRAETVGTRRIYHLAPDGLEALRVEVTRFWMAALADLQRATDAVPSAEEPSPRDPTADAPEQEDERSAG
jgi:DNA-binding transcriptional ArsR family regulator